MKKTIDTPSKEAAKPEHKEALELANKEAAEAGEALALLDGFDGTTVQGREDLAAIALDARERRLKLEAEMEKITKPQWTAYKATRALFTPALDGYSQIEKKAKEKIAEGMVQHNKDAEKALDVVAATGDAEALAKVEAAAAPKGMTLSKSWTYRVTDEKLVPREYMMVQHAKIQLAIAEGVREIPGIEIFQKTDVRKASSKAGE